jgi:outer membrane protein assembly factor BamD (BamD/ComL family)
MRPFCARAAIAGIITGLVICGSAFAAPDITWTPEGGWQKSPAATTTKAGAEFDQAFSLYVKGKYGKSIGLLDDVAKHGGEPLAEEARILLAECYLGAKDYRKAFDKFEDFLEKYPGSRLIDRAYAGEVEVAKAVLGGARIKVLGLRIWSGYGFGEKVVDKITSRRPFSDYAREAQIALARSYLRRNLYIEAASSYQQYVEFFREGPEIQEALLGMGKSLYLDGRGPGYGPMPYYKADGVFKDFIRDYPTSSLAPAARQYSAMAEDNLAQHYVTVGRWYLKMGRTASAAAYFKKVMAEYGQTRWAGVSKTYMDELGPNR